MREGAKRTVAVVMAALAFSQAFPFAALCSTEIDRKEYVWDAASRVTSAKEGGVWSYYEYDAIDQLIEEEKPALSYLTTYTYDANGNRLTRTVNSVTESYVYDEADKLETVSINSNVVKEFTYDAAGRTTAIETGTGVTSLSYDYEGRVTGITYPNTSSDGFAYNGTGARTSTSGTNGSRTFLRAGLGVTSPVLSDGTADYTPGVSRRESSTTKFSHSGLKNANSQTNSSEAVTGSRVYDAFGNVVSSSGSWSGPFGYAGNFGYQKDASGLHLLGHRYYDSSVGRFFIRDPIFFERNDYAYAGNDPITTVDLDGRSSNKFIKAGLKALIGLIGWGTEWNGVAGDEVTDAPRPGFESSDDHVVRNQRPGTTPKPTPIGGRAGAPPPPELPTQKQLGNALRNVGRGSPPRWMRILKKFGKW